MMCMKKKLILPFLFLLFAQFVQAQLQSKPECSNLSADIFKGWINMAAPNADPEQIKTKLPCFTSFEKEGNESKCGGGIYYEDKDFKYLVQRDYIVIGEKFKGKFNVPIMGAKRDDLFTWLGNPKLKDAQWEAYQMQYGTLIVYFNAKKLVNKIIMSTKPTELIDLCTEVN